MSGTDEFVTLKDGTMAIKDLIIRHIGKISDLCVKEFTPSFWAKKPVKVGEGVAIVETYHPDTRMSYINAVNFLQDIMAVYSDKQFLEKLKSINDLQNDQFKIFKEAKGSQDSWIWTKLDFSRQLFGQLILLIDRAKLFSATMNMSDDDIAQMLDEEDEKERERVEWEDENL